MLNFRSKGGKHVLVRNGFLIVTVLGILGGRFPIFAINN